MISQTLAKAGVFEHLENSSEADAILYSHLYVLGPRKVFGISIEAQAPLCGYFAYDHEFTVNRTDCSELAVTYVIMWKGSNIGARCSMDKLILIDGNNIIYRAFFAMPPLTNASGQQTNAVYGFTTIFASLD